MKKIDLLVMKKWSFIFYSVLVMVVAGCSDDVAPITPVCPDNVIEQEIYSDVPIEFGYGGVTKATDEDFLAENKYFGIFTALKGKDGVTDFRNKGNLSIIDNTVIRYVNDFGFKFRYPSEDVVYYYPSSDEEYVFYAYYKYDANNILLNENKYLEDGTMKTTVTSIVRKMDLGELSWPGAMLWAKAAADGNPSIDGFNASAVRKGHSPVFNFKHPMAKVCITVSLAENLTIYSERPNFNYPKVWIQLDMLGLVNSPSEAEFCIAHTDPNKEGKFDEETYVYPEVSRSYYWTGADNSIDKQIENDLYKMAYMRSKENSRSLKCRFQITDTGKTQVPGQGVVMIPPRAADNPLVCRLRLSYSDGSGVRTGYQNYDVTLDPAKYGFNEGYKAGYVYNYNIVIDYKTLYKPGPAYGPYVNGVWLNECNYTKKEEPVTLD